MTAVAVAVQGALDTTVASEVAEMALLHAAVAAWEGQAVLLVGPSGAGKSSLLHACLRAGAEYLSDELAPLDSLAWVHPYPRAPQLRDAHGEQVPRCLSELGVPVANGPRPVALVLCVRHVGGTVLELEPLSASLALLDLLRNSPQPPGRPRWLANLHCLVRSAPVLRGTRGEADPAARMIQALALGQRR